MTAATSYDRRSATEAEMLRLFGDLAMGGGGFCQKFRVITGVLV